MAAGRRRSPSRGGGREARILPALAAVLVSTVTGASHETTRPQGETAACVYRVQSNLVVVPVSVSDTGGRLVRDLGMPDFLIEENGKAQTLSGIAAPGRSRLDLSLLFDVSGSMNHRFRFAQAAAAAFLRRVATPGDTVSLSSIGPEPRMIRRRTEDLGSVLEDLSQLVPTRSATAFYDSIVSATHPTSSSPQPGIRRVQVVLSDGEDNYSTGNGLPEAARALQLADCVFYAINPSGPTTVLNRIGSRGQDSLEELALQTGGTAFRPNAIEELPAIFDRIAAELQAQYVLEYYSSDRDDRRGFRNIVVRVPSRPDLRIRARQGYYTSRS